MTQWLNELWFLTLEAAPWLLLGLVIAALIKAFSDRLAIARYLSGESAGATVRASLIGAPLPLCSCGVVPAVLGLRSAGAGRGPSMAFLVATPETGPDSISVSYGLLGPVYAIARPIAAVVGAILTGLISGRFAGPAPDSTATTDTDSGCCSGEEKENPTAASCCESTPSISGHCDGEDEQPSGSCCGTETAAPKAAGPSTGDRLAQGFGYAFGQVLLDIAPWMLFGLAVAATAVVLIPEGFFDQPWGLVGSYLLMAVIGVPMYVCATASTPIAAGLLVAGMSPGAALVFLLAGPATNIGTLGILKQHFGARLIGLYLACVIAFALIAGITLDLLWRQFDWALPASAPTDHAMAGDWLAMGALAVIVIATLSAYWRRHRKNQAPEEGACGCSDDRDGSQ
ncbi:SO_0444 family Cu/Zn efflux transporter [Guyparkeria hydrothermalis]|uniref:SO_0444 family Cu/Zn efflux transporter n=1 Tax=Guyparkeria hydrothermalis TaxID=923 RepID=UPI00202219FE|nr:SO_0444 family Cu/Zn efflux transporter [Guyparkeria hydrothermalis]MCL7744996.1 SO_0444 family Cu/Zn efflux transporter [Guyparkeria hydrothermalis]